MNDNDIEILELPSEKKKDKFMISIYISLIVLVVLGLLVYFFGYDLVKDFIEV